jgi:EmrB/QacA subfamily drug resistance transporter
MAQSAAKAPSKRDARKLAAGSTMTTRQINLVMIGLLAGMFLSALDQTVVSTSMRTIADDLNGMSLQAWVTTGYMIMSTIATPIYGKLSDIFGRRPLFIIAIAIFLLGSLLAGTAHDMYQLAGWRAVQGLGAGGLMALPLAIMGDMLAPRQRAKYQGLFFAVFGVSSIIGPLIGGLLSGTPEILGITGWRWVFLINIPVGVAALAVVLSFLHLPANHRRGVRIDWWGATFVIMSVAPLLLVAEQGREWGWGSIQSFACYIIGGVGILAFILVEQRMKDDALIPMKLFKSQTFRMATILGVFVGFAMFGGMMTIPLYMQMVLGATPTQSGLLMLPMIVGMMSASMISGQIMSRTGNYQWFPRTGTFLLALGYLYLTFLTYDKPVWFIMVGMFLIGAGLGQLMQTLTVASQNSVDPQDMGVATSSSTFFRTMGGTAGTAVLFSVLFSRIPETIKEAFQNPTFLDPLKQALKDPAVLTNPANKKILDVLLAAMTNKGSAANALNGDTSFLVGADPRLADPFLVGFSNASISVYWICFVVAATAFALSWFLKTPPLRQRSGIEEMAARDAAVMAEKAADQMGAMVDPGTAGGSYEDESLEAAEAKASKPAAKKKASS